MLSVSYQYLISGDARELKQGAAGMMRALPKTNNTASL